MLLLRVVQINNHVFATCSGYFQKENGLTNDIIMGLAKMLFGSSNKQHRCYVPITTCNQERYCHMSPLQRVTLDAIALKGRRLPTSFNITISISMTMPLLL